MKHSLILITWCQYENMAVRSIGARRQVLTANATGGQTFVHLLLLVCWREWRETGKGDLGAWSGTMIGHLAGSQIISNLWIMGSRITLHIYIYVCVYVCVSVYE